MRIAIRKIPENGLNINESVEADSLGLVDADMKWVSPLTVNGSAQRVDNENVFVKAKVKGTFFFICARCLKPLSREIGENLYLNYEIDRNTEYIDLSEDIRQETIIRYPRVALCKEDCKGLCPECGADLNEEECKHTAGGRI